MGQECPASISQARRISLPRGWCLRAGSRVVTHGGQDVEDVHAAGEGDQVVQQVVVAQEHRPLAAMAAIPAET